MKFVVDGVTADGKKTHSEYTFKFDGKDYPQKPVLDGKPDPNGADMISARKVDDYTYETTAKQPILKLGTETGSSSRVLKLRSRTV